MTVEKIILQSAGSLSVAIIAFLLMVLQLVFFFRKPRFPLYSWSVGISFSAMLYAVGVFFEYNFPPGGINQFAGRLEWTAIVLLIHILYGFTFSYFTIDGKRYHLFAGIFHLIVIIFIWSTDFIVSDQFVSRHFIGLANPFIEPDLGPLGPGFVLYGFLACLIAIAIWFRRKDSGDRFKNLFLLGIVFWTLLGIHDGLAALGMRTCQYLMEYGFLVLSFLVIWIVFSRFYEMLSEDKYRMITEFINDGILVVQDGVVVFENPACRALNGQSVVGWTADNLSLIFSEADKEQICKYYDALLHSEDQIDAIVVNIRKGGNEESIVEIKANVIQYNSSIAVLAVLRDITERIRKEEELKNKEEKLIRLKKMEALGLLAGGVAHDLNNVLSGIVSYPELILMDLPEDSEIRQMIFTIQDSGKRAAAIVNELLMIARGASIKKKVMNLNAVISAYIRSPEHSKLLMFHPRVKVETNLERQLLNIEGSLMHFDKIVMNLVSNAAEAIEGDGKVIISTANRYLDQALHGYSEIPKGEYAVLTVEDDGPGIDQEDLYRIFEPFYTKKVMGRSGTGLGLTLVWNVVQDHGFHIDMISNKNGTRFDIYCNTTRDRPVDETSPLQLTHISGHGERILVVDDVKSQREITCAVLDRLGYTSESVSCGEEAVSYIEKNGGVDLLLIDMIMDPGMNGRETYEQIIKIQPAQKAIIASGFAETDDVRQVLAAGAAKFIRKPIIIQELGKAVKETLYSNE